MLPVCDFSVFFKNASWIPKRLCFISTKRTNSYIICSYQQLVIPYNCLFIKLGARISSQQSLNSWARKRVTRIWLAKWCKIHKVYIHSHPMLLLLFTNTIYSHSTTEFTFKKYIYSHLPVYFLFSITFTRCLHSHSTCYIHSHSRSKYSFSIFCAPPLRISIFYLVIYFFPVTKKKKKD